MTLSKIKDGVFCTVSIILIIAFLMSMTRFIPKEGHYVYKEGVEGVDVCYEYVIPE